MRTESWNRLPMVRMTNISINPGEWAYEDLIADTDDAILMETNRSWSIDDRRYQFQFSTEIGWEIKGGKKGRMIKNPSYSGITTEFWNSCDAICSREHWTLWGTPNCGQRPADADDGHRARGVTFAFSECSSGSRYLEMTPVKKKSRAASKATAKHHEAGRFTVAEMENLAERLLKLSDADETEVEIDLSVDALTRFANNTIHQNVAEHTLGISVRVVLDGRTARATTNKTDDDALRRVIAAASRLARNQPKSPDLLPLLKKQSYRKVNHFVKATADATPEDRARAVARVCKFADKEKQTAAGIFCDRLRPHLVSQFQGTLRAPRPHRSAIFDYDSRARFFRLGEIECCGHFGY